MTPTSGVPPVATAEPSPTSPEFPTPSSRNIDVHIAGNVSGQLAVGENIVQVQAAAGAVVNLYQGKPIVPRRRATPVLLPPRPFPSLLGRADEVAAAKSALRAATSFEYYAAAGWGKTALLRYLGQVGAGAYPDGLVYQPADGQTPADLLQFFFDAFYETDSPVPYKPTPGQLRQALEPLRALLILDDLNLDREQLEALMNEMPNCGFLVAARERTLWASGLAASVAGLPKEAAIQLFEEQLGRLLTPAEQPSFERLWSSLKGSPLALIQAAAVMREKTQLIAGLVTTDSSAPPVEQVSGRLVGTLSEDERKILGLLSSVYDAALPPSHVRAITGLPDAPEILRHLTQQGLAEVKDGGYRLAREPTGSEVQTTNPQEWTDRSVRHFADWSKEFAKDLALILELADLLLKVAELATDTKRWQDLLQLVRAIERSFALSGRWDAWQRLLNSGLQAAVALNDRAAEAWALHQLGTRALCLGDVNAASTFLNQALEIRRALGDDEGVRVTNNNLKRLAPTNGGFPWRKWTLRIGTPLVIAVGVSWVFPKPGPDSAAAAVLFPGRVSLEPSPLLEFGDVAVGQGSGTQRLTVHNTGAGPLQVAFSSITDKDFTIVKNSCPPPPATLARDRTCVVALRFTPSSATRHSTSLSVDDTRGNTQTATLQGMGRASRFVFGSPRLDFSQQPVGVPSAPTTVDLRNAGNAPLTIRQISKEGDYELSPCRPTPLTIEAGSACTISVVFKPSAVGPRPGHLIVIDASRVSHSIPLTGPGLAIDPPHLMFGKQTIKVPSKPVQAALKNWGDTDLIIQSIMATGDYSASDCSEGTSIIPAKGTCTISVTFTPTSQGDSSEKLVVTDARGNHYEASLTGSGIAPIAVVPKSIEFGVYPKKTVVPMTIVNKGEGVLAISSISIAAVTAVPSDQAQLPPSLFTWSDSTDHPCIGAQIASGGSCRGEVHFAPPPATASDSYSREYYAVLQVTDNDPSSPQGVSLHGSRQGVIF